MVLSKEPLILSNAASTFFGLSTNSFLNDKLVEATLRYISISNNKSDIAQTRFLKTRYIDGVKNVISPSRFADEGDNIIVLRISSGYDATLTVEEGWVSLNAPPYPTALYLSQYSPTTILVNKEKQCAVILVKNITEKWKLGFCSTLYRILTWLYPPEENPSQDEIAFFRSINQENSDEFVSIVDSCCKDIDFASQLEKKILVGWVSHNRTSMLDSMRNERQSIESSIADYEKALYFKYSELSKIITGINQMMLLCDPNETALYDFFKSHNQLKIFAYHNHDSISFSILETIEYFDEDEFMRIYNDRRSVYWSGKTQLAQKVAYDVFINKRGKFQVESIFELTGINSLSPQSHCVSDNYNDISMPHPHLYHHACLGGNKQYIQEYLKKGDWDLAIEQAIAATKNLRFGDATVFSEFLDDIEHYKARQCIILDDGSRISPIELYQHILAEEQVKTAQ